MTNPVAQLLTATTDGATVRSVQMWCPGCDAAHTVVVDGPIGLRPPVAWQWDESLTAPTLSPSIVTESPGSDGTTTRCLAFVEGGRWTFLPNCTHQLAGQVVDMVPLPDSVLVGTPG